MTGINCDLFIHNQSRSYLNDLVTVADCIIYVCVSYILSPFPCFSKTVVFDAEKTDKLSLCQLISQNFDKLGML
jgi:hypothetical protein